VSATTALVVPLRAFTVGKERLAGVLGPDERAALSRRFADRVLDAAGGLPVAVVSSAAEVEEWARQRGAEVLADPGTLDDAASVGREWGREAGFDRVVVAHADLARARTFDPVVGPDDRPVVTIVPDHRDDGTPVLALPTGADFRFAYGPGSFSRHVLEARRAGLGLRVVRSADLGFDVDLPEDLARVPVSAR